MLLANTHTVDLSEPVPPALNLLYSCRIISGGSQLECIVAYIVLETCCLGGECSLLLVFLLNFCCLPPDLHLLSYLLGPALQKQLWICAEVLFVSKWSRLVFPLVFDHSSSPCPLLCLRSGCLEKQKAADRTPYKFLPLSALQNVDKWRLLWQVEHLYKYQSTISYDLGCRQLKRLSRFPWDPSHSPEQPCTKSDWESCPHRHTSGTEISQQGAAC